MQREIIHFFKDKQGKVVGRLSNGKIAIIDYNYKGTRINADEFWDCEIVIDEPNKAIVRPIQIVFGTKEA